MRLLLAMLVFGTGCIAAEPGKGKETESSPRKACTELEGLRFQGGANNSQFVAFAADDAEYSTYTETSAEGVQSLGLAQCISAGATTVIYIDGAIDHWGARADLPNAGPDLYLHWTDGHTLVAYNAAPQR